MILLLGAKGYIGQAFARELRARGERFIPLSRATLDYTRFELLFEYVRKMEPDFLINAGGIWGKPNVDACEEARVETFQANTLLPQIIARVCTMTNTPWGHVSSACIYSGAKVYEEKSEVRNQPRMDTDGHGFEPRKDTNYTKESEREGKPPEDTNYTKRNLLSSGGGLRVERDLETPRMRQLFGKHPEFFVGFDELDDPNFCFRSPPCNYLAGTKALAEERLKGTDGLYIWRIGRPFDEKNGPENVLTRLLSYPKILDHFAALSNLDEFVRACLELVERKAPYGIYNVTNPGALTTRSIVDLVERKLKPARSFKFWRDANEFYACGDRAPRSSCIIDSGKLARLGIRMQPAKDALEEAIKSWADSMREERRSPGEPVLKVI